jgi:hypothetical protein
LEFRLIYEGPLPAQGTGDSRAKEKHAIRKALHLQLKEVFSQFPFLNRNKDFFAQNYVRCGFNFVPLINQHHYHARYCKLDILFLRRDAPGNLIKSGGDIDNRIKVLFDGLRIVDSCNELGGASPEAGEDPFFCLLEDDRAITEVNITTDRLFTAASGNIHDVLLIIRVRTPRIDIDDEHLI